MDTSVELRRPEETKEELANRINRELSVVFDEFCKYDDEINIMTGARIDPEIAKLLLGNLVDERLLSPDVYFVICPNLDSEEADRERATSNLEKIIGIVRLVNN